MITTHKLLVTNDSASNGHFQVSLGPEGEGDIHLRFQHENCSLYIDFDIDVDAFHDTLIELQIIYDKAMKRLGR